MASVTTKSAVEAMETPSSSDDQIVKPQVVKISAPRFTTAKVRLVGIAPYVQSRFSQKAQILMETAQQAGSRNTKGKAKVARDFEADYLACTYHFTDGGYGLPASCFRNAIISACRLVGFTMTMAKLSVFVEQDGVDAIDSTPLVRINGLPRMIKHAVRNSSSVTDIRARAMWDSWSVDLYVSFDADQFSTEDLANLLLRAGRQVGIGEGRPFSKNSAGMGWGMFTVESGIEESAAH